MRKIILITACILSALALAARADDVTDTLQSAIEAYNDGDLQYAIEELDYAKQLMLSMKTDALSVYLPSPPEGWTMEPNTEIGATLGMMGGGVGAEADYTNGSDSFTVTIMADNPMIAAMGAMIANAAAMGMKVERIGRQKFAIEDGTVQGLINNRILVKAEGDDTDQLLSVLGTMDFKALSNFGQ
ncbi:hypothetical protein [Pseudooceanicola nitratireducens]|uniref:hypothetical protein n=1 Tax=Pseudooceanicola nitratireducens TaxID=517719 RepID=UPI0023F54E11|nr:hypothetical protein [Pseudooceanicola nitratireducens]